MDAAAVAVELARLIDERGLEYALGGAIALAYWAVPRGTVDVDLTLFVPPDKPSEAIRLLGDLGCEMDTPLALAGFRENWPSSR